jgi:hypothetical protein
MEPKDVPQMDPPGEEHTSIGTLIDDFVMGLVESSDSRDPLIWRVSRAALPVPWRYCNMPSILFSRRELCPVSLQSCPTNRSPRLHVGYVQYVYVLHK